METHEVYLLITVLISFLQTQSISNQRTLVLAPSRTSHSEGGIYCASIRRHSYWQERTTYQRCYSFKTPSQVQNLEQPSRYLWWMFTYFPEKSVTMSQGTFSKNLAKHADFFNINPRKRLFTNSICYDPPQDGDIVLMDTATQNR